MARGPGRTGRPWLRMRAFVLARDAGVCWMCGHSGAGAVDHVVPLAQGGDPLDPANLRAIHTRCNSRKGSRVGVTPYDPTSERW